MIDYFRFRSAPHQPGWYEIVAVTDVPNPTNQHEYLYQGGEVVPFSLVQSATDAKVHAADMNRRYQPRALC